MSWGSARLARARRASPQANEIRSFAASPSIGNYLLPSQICHFQFDIRHLSFVICHLSSVICHFEYAFLRLAAKLRISLAEGATLGMRLHYLIRVK